MTRRVTQRDVALAAGVSRSLVSLVLQGAENVSDAKRSAVREAVAQLGYRPNAAARNLGRRTHTIGVMVQDLHYPYFAEVIDGIQTSAEQLGLNVLINTGHGRPTVERRSIETFLELRMDGLVLISPLLADRDIAEVARFVPTVLVGRPTSRPEVDSVHTDDVAGGFLATKHLLELGHRRILHVGLPDTDENSSGSGRRAGYRRALASAGVDALHRVVQHGDDMIASARGTDEDPHPVTALFAHNDFIAVDAWAHIRDDRNGAPLAVAGYDNTNFAGLPLLSLTSVDQPRAELGRTAVEMLDERMSGRDESRHVVFEPTLVVRDSSGPALPV